LQAHAQDVAQPLEQGLAVLCYHGLTARDEGGRRYRAVGALFQDWFVANVAGRPGSDTPPVEKGLRSQ
jgi:hypothetical protein